VPLFNGAAGLSLVPSPLQSHFNPQGRVHGVMRGRHPPDAGHLLVRPADHNAPFGRSLRAMRDNDLVADSLGKNVRSLRTSSLIIGGAIAGLSGAVLVGFINLWDPQAWDMPRPSCCLPR